MARFVLLIATLLAACSVAPTAISRQRALELALQAAQWSDVPVVLDAREGRLGDLRNFDPGDPVQAERADIFVWEVDVKGTISICPPTGAPCFDKLATARIWLDRASGNVVAIETSAN